METIFDRLERKIRNAERRRFEENFKVTKHPFGVLIESNGVMRFNANTTILGSRKLPGEKPVETEAQGHVWMIGDFWAARS